MRTFLTIDIGGTFIKYALMTEEMEIVEESKIPTPSSLPTFLESLEKLIATYQDRIEGVAISCAGNINTKTGFVYQGGMNRYLAAFPLGKHLTSRFELPVSILNDADAAGLAEARLGNLQGVDCGAALVLGTAVGLALVADGEVMNLSQLQAKEALALPIKEAIANKESDTFQDIGQVLELHLKGVKSVLANAGSAVQFVKRASQELELPEEDGLAVFESLKEGEDSPLQEMFQDYCREVAYLILNLRSLIKIDRVVIGGGISQQAILIESIQDRYQEIVKTEAVAPHLIQPVEIQTSHFHNQANLIGALCFYLEQHKTS